MEKADYIIKADHLIPMDNDLPVIHDGAVAVQGDTIVSVGTFSDVSSQFSSENILGGRDRAVFPGLINAHTHAAMVYFRGLADDLPLMEWLEKHIWPAEFKWLTAEFVDNAIELACLEMLKAGVTTYTDMYLYQGVAAKKVEKIGMRGFLCSGVVDFPWRDYAQSADDYFIKGEEFLNTWKGNDLITTGIAPHAVFTCNPDNYMRAKELAGKYDVHLHTHLAETQFEVAQCKETFGKTPVEHLDAIGFLSSKVSAAHCVWLTDKEIEILAEKHVGVAHCVESNLKLASGFAPVPALLKAGVKIGLGTDGAASNNDLSILGEISTATKLHKAVSQDATVVDSKTALLMATQYGADIIGLGDTVGSLTVGKKADIVIADLNKPHLSPMYDIYSHIAYSMHPADIETVMVNGKILIENGNPTTLDQDDVLAKARSWQNKIKEQ